LSCDPKTDLSRKHHVLVLKRWRFSIAQQPFILTMTEATVVHSLSSFQRTNSVILAFLVVVVVSAATFISYHFRKQFVKHFF
ncbi:hypothetical protein B9G55_23145, partial [Saccharibacillus sp. O16]